MSTKNKLIATRYHLDNEEFITYGELLEDKVGKDVIIPRKLSEYQIRFKNVIDNIGIKDPNRILKIIPMQNKFLYGWVFTYNPFIDKYLCTNRDNYHKLWDNQEDESILKSSSETTLKEIIMLNQGDLRKVIEWKKTNKYE